MEYMEFIDRTRDMNPQQRSAFFDKLPEESKAQLVEQGGDFTLIAIQSRLIIGAEKIEAEKNTFKREQMQRVYDSLEQEYMTLRHGEKRNEVNPA